MTTHPVSIPENDTNLVSKYVLGQSFVLRMTGFPVRSIRLLSSSCLAKSVGELQAARHRVIAEAEQLLASGKVIDRKARRKLTHVVKDYASWQESANPAPTFSDLPPNLDLLIIEAALAASNFRQLYDEQLTCVRISLYQFVKSDRFQEVLLRSSPRLLEFIPNTIELVSSRNSQVRKRELTWISYLQRLTMKNETISFFGPSAWGTFDKDQSSASDIKIGEQLVKENVVYIERWVCEALAEKMSLDPEVRDLLKLQLAPDLVIRGEVAFLARSGVSFCLSSEELEFLNGFEAELRFSGDSAVAVALIEKKLLMQQVELPISARPFDALGRIVEGWAHNPAKVKWQTIMTLLETARGKIHTARDLETRAAAVLAVNDQLTQAGIDIERGAAQDLYASRLPVNEDCHLNAEKLVLGRPVMEQLLVDAAPWFDLWRDSAGLYATRLLTAIRERWLVAGGKPISLLRFGSEMSKAWVTLAEIDQEIQLSWRKQIEGREHKSVVSLTAEDTEFLRKNFELRRMKAFDNPSPDIQIAAKSQQALQNGDFTLLIAEIHADFTSWQNGLFVWCPDPDAFARDYMHQGGQGTAIVGSKHPPHFSSAHTSLWIYPYCHQWSFVGVSGPEGFPSVRSADTLVDVTEDDVLLVHRDGRQLGSLLHNWYTILHTHRLEFNGGFDHSPRLMVGRVVVQRESWTYKVGEELRQAARKGGSTAFAALYELKGEMGLPDEVFVRGGVTNRLSLKKDMKPIFLDFRNPLLIEVVCKLLIRFEEIFVTEALPATEECWMEGPEGHYSSEFRTIVMASAESRAAERATG